MIYEYICVFLNPCTDVTSIKMYPYKRMVFNILTDNIYYCYYHYYYNYEYKSKKLSLSLNIAHQKWIMNTINTHDVIFSVAIVGHFTKYN